MQYIVIVIGKKPMSTQYSLYVYEVIVGCLSMTEVLKTEEKWCDDGPTPGDHIS